MGVIGVGDETYLYINGIKTLERILLHDSVSLLPITATFHYGKISGLLKSDLDYAVAAVSGRNLASQIEITAENPEQLVTMAWNAAWDCLLLGALFHCDVMDNLQCDKPVEKLDEAKYVNITNYAFRSILNEPYLLTSDDISWINSYYSSAYDLLEKESYMTAVHAMASYQWHSLPRVQLAIIWSGIEALFQASTEISFRISLYIANFLSNGDKESAKTLFDHTRKLYSARSASVHGSKIKGDVKELVNDSAVLLNQIIRRCAEVNALPEINDLVFL